MPRRILVIPEYNEAATIIDVLTEAAKYVDRVIVVNDGSHDHSAELVSDWARDLPNVTLLNLAHNQGVSGALLRGFAYAYLFLEQGFITGSDLIINIDADGQHRPEEIPGACELLLQGNYDVVLGERTLRGYPWFKHIGNWGLSLWASLLSGYRYHDVECGFRVMRAELLPALLAYFLGRRYSCSQEIGIITASLKFKVNNRFPSGIRYYRSGARVRDGVVNLIMGSFAAVRVRLGIRKDPHVRALAALSDVQVVHPFIADLAVGE